MIHLKRLLIGVLFIGTSFGLGILIVEYPFYALGLVLLGMAYGVGWSFTN